MFNGDLRKRLQDRPLLKNRQRLFGQGQLQQKLDETTQRIKQNRPDIIPKVNEKLSTLNLGSRVKELVPQVAKKPVPKTQKKVRTPLKSKKKDKDGFSGDISISI